MQANEQKPKARQMTGDFDFGAARREAGAKPRSFGIRPGLTAGLVAFAFSLALFTPITAKAELILPTGSAVAVTPDLLPDLLMVRDDGRGWGKRRALPRVCAISVDDRGGQSWYSGNCLRERGLRAELPRDCAVGARLMGERDRFYPEKCLRRAGFNTGR